MNTETYFSLLQRQLHEIFTIRKHGSKVPEREKYRCEGFMHAARVLGVADGAELLARMEQAHLAVFGITIAERQQREGSGVTLDDDFLDIPTVIRRGGMPDLGREDKS